MSSWFSTICNHLSSVRRIRTPFVESTTSTCDSPPSGPWHIRRRVAAEIGGQAASLRLDDAAQAEATAGVVFSGLETLVDATGQGTSGRLVEPAGGVLAQRYALIQERKDAPIDRVRAELLHQVQQQAGFAG